jgi:hypothetical protein
VRLRWLSALAAATIVLGASASVASASQSHKVVSEWTAADGAFSTALSKWESVVEGGNLSKAKKASLAFIPAINTFDSKLQKIHFTGKTATDIGSLISENKKEIKVMSHVTGLRSLVSQFSALGPAFRTIGAALSKDLGIPEADIII